MFGIRNVTPMKMKQIFPTVNKKGFDCSKYFVMLDSMLPTMEKGLGCREKMFHLHRRNVWNFKHLSEPVVDRVDTFSFLIAVALNCLCDVCLLCVNGSDAIMISSTNMISKTTYQV